MPKLTPHFSAHHGEVFLHTLLAFSSAVLLLLIFPKFDLRFLAPVALTPLLVVVARTQDGWQRFVYGWGAGILFWFFLCTWIQFVLEVHGGMGRWGGWGSFLLFAVLKGLHMAVFTCLAGPLMHRGYAVPAVAALWTGLERTHGTFGFAWLDLGNAGITMSVPLRLAPFIGVYGLSFVFAMLAAALACVLLGYSRFRLIPLLALPLLWLLPTIPERTPATQQALLVQPNIDPTTEWTSLVAQKTQEQLALISEALPSPLIIWPELPAPFYYYDDPIFHDAATQIAKHHGYFLFGTVAYTHEKQPLNSALLLGPDGSESGRYDKINLVPFGEFVPPLFSFVNRITHEAGDFVPGHDIKLLPAAGHELGVFICYESAFPDLVRQFTKRGADVLVNLSNDAYFGRSEAREQHLSLVRMRAVENRRYIIRSTNDGLSAVIDPAGLVVKRVQPYQELAIPIRYGVVESTTFYARHGDWFAWGCLGTGFLLAGREFLFRRRSQSGR
ncbi:MAG: apolipoprotein N-acyltransferase [Acidobacteriaceae bacterium]|nr:apolipoprotein N-acyltransferase [Acidobacteriaceae bacterium]MBV9780534.1 apolipoprotein N-acyltransferase [Acidobacteriaceae bacterium]